jgi:hypothetical protein
MSVLPSNGTSRHVQAKVTFLLAAIVVVTLLVFTLFISSSSDGRIISISVIALALSAGMIAGTAISPSDGKESKRFATFGQALAVFVSGYLASKLDGLVTAITWDAITQLSPVNIFRLLAFAATFLAVGKATFSCRSYDH